MAVFIKVVLGLIVGVIVGVLVAPASGEDTLRRLKGKVRTTRDKVVQKAKAVDKDLRS